MGWWGFLCICSYLIINNCACSSSGAYIINSVLVVLASEQTKVT